MNKVKRVTAAITSDQRSNSLVSSLSSRIRMEISFGDSRFGSVSLWTAGRVAGGETAGADAGVGVSPGRTGGADSGCSFFSSSNMAAGDAESYTNRTVNTRR